MKWELDKSTGGCVFVLAISNLSQAIDKQKASKKLIFIRMPAYLRFEMNKAERVCKIHWLNLRSANSRYRSFYTKKKTKKEISIQLRTRFKLDFFLFRLQFRIFLFWPCFFQKKIELIQKNSSYFRVVFRINSNKKSNSEQAKTRFFTLAVVICTKLK